MSRINIGIPPELLSGKHLLAEHREIKRIPNLVSKGKYTMEGQPNKFVLGTGHVKFFYDKCQYLIKRYNKILEECIKRGYNVTCYREAWVGVPDNMLNDYKVTTEALGLIKQRIEERGGNILPPLEELIKINENENY